MLKEILTPEVLEALGVLLSTILFVGITRAGHFLSQRFGTDRQRAILERVERAAATAVLTTHQTFVEKLKEKSEDGTLDPLDAAEALKFAVSAAKVELGSAGLAELQRVSQDADALLRLHVEAALVRAKNEGLLR
jgi:hypothetical protein